MPSINKIHIEKLDNGLTVLVQPMPWQRTAAFSLSVPGGIQHESSDLGGLGGLACEMVQRGAGDHSSRDLVAIQDNLGVDRNSGVTAGMVSFGCAMPAASLQQTLQLYATIVRNPHLPEDQLQDAKMMSMQELRAMQDEPTHRVMRRLRERHYGQNLGRSIYGTEEGILKITNQDVRDFYESNYHAGGAILAVAGAVDVDDVVQWAKDGLADWKTGPSVPLESADGTKGYEHLESQSSQTHIGFAFDSIPYGHEDYFRMRAGIGILSDGMSSRLFDRVREKRGLCYTVTASCHSMKQSAGVFGYAGTTPERAQETLDVTLHEIEHLVDDLQQDELDRWKVRIESGLIMEQESSASRASSLASDHYQIGRPMTTEELETAIVSLTLDDVREYWTANPPKNYRVVTLGPDALKVNHA